MYKWGEKLAFRILILVLASALMACGGSATNESSPTDVSLNGKASSNKSVATETQSSPQAAQASSAAISSTPNITQEKDSTPPSTTQLLLQQVSENSLTLKWDSSTDNTGVSAYKIERNGQLITTLDFPTYVFTDTNLQPYTAYTYTITAIDRSGNSSNDSAPFTVRTLGNTSSVSSTITNRPTANSSQDEASSINASSRMASSVPTSSSPKSSSKTSSSATSSLIASSRAASSIPASSSPGSSSKTSSSTTSSLIASSRATSSSTTSSNPGSSSKSSSSTTSSAITSSKAASSSSAVSSNSNSSNAATQAKSITISWAHPHQRENGQYLELNEIGGYEIRYRNKTESLYTYIKIDSNDITEYKFANADDLEFEIAVFDTDGVYSRFVKFTQ